MKLDTNSVIPISIIEKIDLNKKIKIKVSPFLMKNMNTKTLDKFSSLLRSHLKRSNSR